MRIDGFRFAIGAFEVGQKHARGIYGLGVEGDRLGGTLEEGPAKGKDCGSIATRDDDDLEMDGESIKNGAMDARNQPAIPRPVYKSGA